MLEWSNQECRAANNMLGILLRVSVVEEVQERVIELAALLAEHKAFAFLGLLCATPHVHDLLLRYHKYDLDLLLAHIGHMVRKERPQLRLERTPSRSRDASPVRQSSSGSSSSLSSSSSCSSSSSDEEEASSSSFVVEDEQASSSDYRVEGSESEESERGEESPAQDGDYEHSPSVDYGPMLPETPLVYRIVSLPDRSPWLCPLCSKVSQSRCALTDHIRIHTGEAPFQCNECPNRFKQSSHLYQHERWHRKENMIECKGCGWETNIKSNMTKHLKRGCKGVSYTCSECKRKFVDRGSRTKHIKREHRL